MRIPFTLAFIFLFSFVLSGQRVFIPAAGNSWAIPENQGRNRIIAQSGIRNWEDTSTVIRTYFMTNQPGEFSIFLIAKVNSGKSEIRLSFEDQMKSFTVENVTFDTIYIGRFLTDKIGYHFAELRGSNRTGEIFAEIPGIIVEGPVVAGKMNFVKDDFHFGRRGPSVHLRYEIPTEAADVVWFYNEITVPEGEDVKGSYFMANGFADGYFGIQVNSESERRILFSVWSPYKTDKPGDIPEEYKIILLKKGSEVVTGEFGNEGSGGQSFRRFNWKAGNTYRFLLKGTPSVNGSTDYTAWFFAPEIDKWELIAGFRRPKTGNYLKNLYSFLENFIPETGNIPRKGYYSNQWIRDSAEKWHELTAVRFTADATARKGARLDYAGGSENGRFFLKNCGFFDDITPMDQTFTRPGTGKPPMVDFADLE
jgi:Domain of unknown function (DUF3472)/Domain of unknown function (DUF5077)